jgi:hypothetical protein
LQGLQDSPGSFSHPELMGVAILGSFAAECRGFEPRRPLEGAPKIRSVWSFRTLVWIALAVRTIYGEGRKPMNAEDLTEIERTGRRCGVCQSGRGWRRLEVVRPPEREPVVLCSSCRARFGDDPPVGRKPEPAPEPLAPPKPRASERRTERRPDRLRAALREMPGSFSTATAARAAGLNNERTLARLHDLERRGEVQRVGNRWSAESPRSDVASAMDRLEARTSNLRIVRDKTRVG